MASETIIVGGGLSGTLVAIQLLRRLRPGDRVTVIERSGTVGKGIAYGTQNPDHLLNVPAYGMTAFPDAPEDFVWWWSVREERPESEMRARFAPRMVYAEYIADRLQRAITESLGEFRAIHGTAVEATNSDGRFQVRLDDGTTLEGTSVVLALGNQAPAALAPLRPLMDSSIYQPNPWKASALEGLDRDAHVLLIGTGLTMIDAVVTLVGSGHQGPITAVSRRGMLPQRHILGSPPRHVDLSETPKTARALMREISGAAKAMKASGGDWRGVIDGLRAETPGLWAAMPWPERQRFLSRLTPYWDVHRHRIAPEIHDLLTKAMESGQFRTMAGHLGEVSDCGDHARVGINLRSGDEQTIDVHRIVNCTGPDTSLLRSRLPILESLVRQGLSEYDPLGLGLMVDPDGRTATEGLYAIGPVCRGCRWETTAAPELRVQALAVAKAICHATTTA